MTNNSKQSTLHDWLVVFYANINSRIFLPLLNQFLSMESLFAAPHSTLHYLGLSHKQIQALKCPHRKRIEADFAWQAASSLHHILCYEDEDYPRALREISDPPLVLFVHGNCKVLNTPQIAIVGARHATPAGCGYAEQFAYALAQAQLTITSGLALGIDGAAHCGALNASGHTIAVMGAGLKHIYPRSHTKLANRICEMAGALVSEFPLSSPPLAYHFPCRNRIIAGMSLGVLVIEAALKSGSLITARLAVENGRDVFAVPGPIHHPLARGCHYLIKQGAKIIENVSDVLEEYSHQLNLCITKPVPSEEPSLTMIEKKIYAFVDYETTTLDSIILRSGLTTTQVSSILLTLEMQGLIQITTGGYVRMVRKLN